MNTLAFAKQSAGSVRLALLCRAGLVGASSAADTNLQFVVVPAGYAAIDAHDGTLHLSDVGRVQECYGASLFLTNPVAIVEL